MASCAKCQKQAANLALAEQERVNRSIKMTGDDTLAKRLAGTGRRQNARATSERRCRAAGPPGLRPSREIAPKKH